MTAQHAPHTPPLWRRFFSLPRTILGWLSVVLIAVPMGLFFLGIDLIQMVSPWVLICGPASIVVGLIAVIWRHERSALVWLAMVLGLLPTPFAIQWVLYVTNSPWYSP
jgi:hypothetical protein